MAAERLSVLVVGAGIAGLASGLALRAYADVTILESASELKEVGAAISLGKGVLTMLRAWGVRLEDAGTVAPQFFQTWLPDGTLVAETPFLANAISVHRADLQRVMVQAATTPDGPGYPCKVLLGQKVASVNTEAGIVTVANGTEFSADVVIAADGIRSVVRPFVTGDAAQARPAGESAYRTLIPVDDLVAKDHPIVKAGAHNMVLVKGDQRQIIAYPIRGGSYLNIACTVPDLALNEETSEKWTSQGSVNALLQSFKSYAPVWTDLLACAKEVSIWQLRDIDPLKTWVRGRTILIGDAAHAMLPHQGSGAYTAIEDAEALGAFLRHASRADVPGALRRVFAARFRRASAFQALSRAHDIYNAPRAEEAALFERWNYPGVEQWVREHPDMVLPVEDSS